MRLSTLYKRLQSLTPQVQVQNIEKTIKREQRKILNLNREQMLRGVRSDGKKIRPFYKPATIKAKRRLGQPFDRVTLRNKGIFQTKMILNGNSFTYRITSTDYKTSKLVGKYGREIFGFTKSNQREINKKIVLPAHLAFIRKKLLGVR